MHAANSYANRLSRRESTDTPGLRGHADEILDGFFSGAVSSFREAYVSITGDRRVTGRVEDVNFDRLAVMTRFAEAVDTSTFSDVLGQALNRALQAEYSRQMANTLVWRKVAKVGRLNDFRTHYSVRMGGYGALPAVTEGSAYQALSSPGDEAIGYAATKRGGTETITLEAIANDDVGLIREIPKRLATAAARTLGSFVLDFLRTNATIYDGVALFHATHGNLGSSALSAVSLYAAWLAMGKQAEYGSTERLHLRGKYLLVPYELEELANNLLVRDTNNDRFFIQNQGIEVVPVWDWTDANDWVLAADPNARHGIEVGFLDGREDPEFFIQDVPSSGSIFSNDRITLKIRHIYGGAVTDFRPFYKGAVA
ncbi:MAG: hypothetical protein U1F52_21610 [Burkholderiales bacterium]